MNHACPESSCARIILFDARSGTSDALYAPYSSCERELGTNTIAPEPAPAGPPTSARSACRLSVAVATVRGHKALPSPPKSGSLWCSRSPTIGRISTTNAELMMSVIDCAATGVELWFGGFAPTPNVITPLLPICRLCALYGIMAPSRAIISAGIRPPAKPVPAIALARRLLVTRLSGPGLIAWPFYPGRSDGSAPPRPHS
jgi:hypothetical protein